MADTGQQGDECVHLLPPGQCAYCSGSWAREQRQLAREQAEMLRRIAKKREAQARGLIPYDD